MANINKEELDFTPPKEVLLSDEDSKKYFSTDKKMRFTDVSLYSTTPTEQSLYTVSLLSAFYTEKDLKNKIITEANACIGGNTWTFADACKSVNSVEISDLHSDILKHNMSALGRKNITVYNNNYMEVYKDLEQDILFLDPPWGGVDYKNNKIELYYKYNGTTHHLYELVNELSYLCELLIMKVPYNSDFTSLQNNNFLHYEKIDIKTPDGSVLYSIVLLYNIKKINSLPIKNFNRMGYKQIVYKFK
jgi:predicted RNA methylase